MTNKSIVVFGEALVDIFKNATVVGGAPFNVARHLSGFREQPLFISAIGHDNAADLIQHELNQFQLSRDGVQILADKKTGFVQVHENNGHHIFEIMSDCAYDFIDSTKALKLIAEQKINHRQKILYHGTLCLRGNTSRHAFQSIANLMCDDSQAKIFCDINWRKGHVKKSVVMQSLQDADVIKLSIEELQMVLVWFNILVSCNNKPPCKDIVELPIQSLMSKLKAELLLITYGDLGSAAFSSDGLCLASAPISHCPSIVDTVGAGDAFASVMLLAITKEWPIDLALQRANQFASDICGVRGATPSDLSFYRKYIEAWTL